MAVVKTEELFFNGRKIKRKISCSFKGVFSTTLPREVVELLGVHEVIEADSLGKVESQWSLLIGQFNKAQTSERKVILVKFDAQAVIYRDETFVFRKGTPGFMNDGIQIEFSAAVYTETTVKMEGDKVNVTYKIEKSSIPSTFEPERGNIWHGIDSFHVLEWSEEREAAFLDLCTKFEDLILRLDWLFEDKNKLLKVLESNQKLLPG